MTKEFLLLNKLLLKPFNLLLHSLLKAFETVIKQFLILL
jgi:hypothetical protein